ncbi:MAG: hypothetical protein ACKPKO_52305, partial [Candidatus Fonsibacter sp.]
QQLAKYRPDTDNLLVYTCILMLEDACGGISSQQHAEEVDGIIPITDEDDEDEIVVKPSSNYRVEEDRGPNSTYNDSSYR